MWKYTLEVDGMMCGMCEAHMNDTVRQAFRVKKVKSSHTKGRTEIVTEEELDEDRLRAAAEAIGYRVGRIEKEPYRKHGLFG